MSRYSDKVMCQKCHHNFAITHKIIYDEPDDMGDIHSFQYCYECGKACDGNVVGIIK